MLPLLLSAIGWIGAGIIVLILVILLAVALIYNGLVSKRNRVQERLREHLPDGKNPVPGAKVQIERMPSIADARAKEARVIKRTQPRYNVQGK